MNFVPKIDIFNRYVVKKFTNTLHLPTFHLKYLRKKSFVFRWINWDGWLPKNVRLRKTKENLWNFKLHPFHFQVDWSNPQNLVFQICQNQIQVLNYLKDRIKKREKSENSLLNTTEKKITFTNTSDVETLAWSCWTTLLSEMMTAWSVS